MKAMRIVSYLLVFALVLVMTACSSSAPSTSEPAGQTSAPATDSTGSSASGTKTEKKVTASFWTDFPNNVGPIFEEAIQKYTELHPNCTIEFELFPGADRAEKLALAKESGTLPALLFAASFSVFDEAHQGYMLPVTSAVKPVSSDISQSTLEQITIGNEIYMYPLYTSPFGLHVNADLVREAGLGDYIPENPYEIITWSLDDFENVILPTLAKHFAGTEKYAFSLFAGNDQADTHNHNLLRILGGTVFDGGRVVAADNEKTVQALDKLYDWYSKGYTNRNAATKLATECNADFQNGLVAINSGQYSAYLNYLSAMEQGKINKFDLRLATVPKQDGQTLALYIYGACMMKVDEAQQELALGFLEWLSSDEGKASLTKFNTIGVPAFSSIAKEQAAEYPVYAEYEKVDKYIYDFTGGVPGYVSTRASFFPALQAVFSDKQSSKDALAEYQEKANKVIDEYAKRSVALNK